MNGILDGSIQRDEGVKYYIVVEYDPKSYKEYCNFFCSTSLPLLMQLVPNGGSYKDVRVVYTFAAWHLSALWYNVFCLIRQYKIIVKVVRAYS